MLTTDKMIVTLRLLVKMDRFDCVDVMRAFEHETGERIDHHEFAYFLDWAREQGFVHIVRPGGFTVYAWGKK